MTTTKRDHVVAIDTQLHQAGLPTYTQVLEILRYLHQQAELSNLPASNGAMRCATRIKQEAAGALSEVY